MAAPVENSVAAARYQALARRGCVAIAALGLVCSGTIAAVFVIGAWPPNATAPNAAVVIVPAILAVCLTTVFSPLLWYRLVADGRRFRPGAAAISGALVVVLVHIATIEAALGVAFAGAWLDGDKNMTFADMLWLMLVLPFRSILTLGWLSVPPGIVSAWAIAMICQYRLNKHREENSK